MGAPLSTHPRRVARLRSSGVPSLKSGSNAPPSRKDMMRWESAPVSGQAMPKPALDERQLST
eukprot:9312129-Heterocapsa_arctica.AAC.1